MTMTPARAALSRGELVDLWSRMCRGKRVLEEHEAYATALRMRGQGEPVSAYPCPMRRGHGEHAWHVGHSPSVYRMTLLARYLRFGADDG
jgi:hypothetical protein